ncbi:type II toxin-antitoxin system VapC family toxin [Microvirga sp. VF16]|uniref:type II toxin-antitoxin system VapC family toxin n=1 Tax=Microvirga sp. VF16 TaxID=2807101 RepID=UPI00193C8DE5|nr:type II toxin-antitoxin system VapC family toxin [Microvirga sp. VF16]QRM35628.1 type II toxin-antitoxin system VapC family toxin [Microvirga sp. VF16]
MRILLDTHALLWWLEGDPRIERQAQDLVTDPANDILVSIASLWELVVKVRVGKLEADIRDIGAAINAQGFETLAIRPEHLEDLIRLPMHHRDPFDHLLIAQAIAEGLTLLSEDRHVSAYPVAYVTCTDKGP